MNNCIIKHPLPTTCQLSLPLLRMFEVWGVTVGREWMGTKLEWIIEIGVFCWLVEALGDGNWETVCLWQCVKWQFLFSPGYSILGHSQIWPRYYMKVKFLIFFYNVFISLPLDALYLGFHHWTKAALRRVDNNLYAFLAFTFVTCQHHLMLFC